MALRVFCFSLFLIRIRLLIGDSFRSKISILTGFILGFPANEIVIPIILMAYLQTGQLVEMSDQAQLFSLLSAHGWTAKTAVCMAVFSLFHWPCSTTCLTIRKETGSWFWTLTAFLLPTFIGISLCFAMNLLLS